MKKITTKTILKQFDKTYQAVEVEGIIYWVDFSTKVSEQIGYNIDEKNISIILSHPRYNEEMCKIIAQSFFKIKDIPVINLDIYVENIAEKNYPHYEGSDGIELFERSGFVNGYETNPNHYTLKDVEKVVLKAVDYAREGIRVTRISEWENEKEFEYTDYQILSMINNEINSIWFIEIDENFKIMNYE